MNSHRAGWPDWISTVTVRSQRKNCGRDAPVIETRTADHPDDDQLIVAIAAGDDQAYSNLVHRYGDRLYSYLLRLSGSAADAEDLLQETFLRILRSLEPERISDAGQLIAPPVAALDLPEPAPATEGDGGDG